jgi:SAM-dependent methyltransferase
MARRNLWDAAVRAMTRPPLPPRSLLANIQLGPFVSEYINVGRRSSESIREAIATSGLDPSAPLRVLDFGCGSARTLRHLIDAPWQLSGCDIDAPAIEWARANIGRIDFRVNRERPPLPWEPASFDVVFAISLFTHFGEQEALSWRDELARVTRRGGIVIISSMGPSVLANFPAHDSPDSRRKLEETGAVHLPQPGGFNAQAAFHTLRGMIQLGAPQLELVSWHEQGLDGFQDLSIYRKV